MFENEYYVIQREHNKHYPLLGWKEGVDIHPDMPIVYSDAFKLKLGKPIPEKYELVDFHKLPEPVVSQKIFDILFQERLINVQFVPAFIEHNENVEYGYYYCHVFNYVPAIDMEKSNYKLDMLGDISILNSFSLSVEKLKKIKLRNRLLFIAEEYESLYIIHESLVEKINKAKPKGVRFIPVDEWSIGSAFQD
ncbi:MAG: hypothetical protein D6B28_02790 [Gammaproteobacteria bacterium]|nr:MAG: hypothetical protein D6B28_02790 [Gammaproteobacteria bacterium]